MATVKDKLVIKSKSFVKIGRKARKYIKRSVSKYWRRMGKKYLDDAPIKRPTNGWSD